MQVTPWSIGGSGPGSGGVDLGDFAQETLPLGRIVALDSGDEAGVQVVAEDSQADLLQSCLDGLKLSDDVDAIGPVFDHSLDTPDVPLDAFQPFEPLGGFHGSLPHSVPPQGAGAAAILTPAGLPVKPAAFPLFDTDRLRPPR